VADLLALMGDSIDNIPGAPGIGDKGARDLIQRFGSVEGALEHAAEVERKMYRESLQNNREQILLSKRLATIDTRCRWNLKWRTWRRRSPTSAS
jgi:DNA polymerase-1